MFPDKRLYLTAHYCACIMLTDFGFFLFRQKYEIPQYFTCLEFSSNGDVITGDSNGSITVWGKGTSQHCLPVFFMANEIILVL